MTYPTLTLPRLSTEDITRLVLSEGIRTTGQFNAAAMELFVAAEEIEVEHRLRALAAIANKHGLTYGRLVDTVGLQVQQLVREDLQHLEAGDLPDTEIVRAVMAV